MRFIVTSLLIAITSTAFPQPSATTVQADIKKEFGPNCLSVSLLGGGSTSTEYVNGGYRTFYRVPVLVKSKTDMPGVTAVSKGAAKYNRVSSNKYSFNQYAPGTSEYIGLKAPDTAAIRALLLSFPDYGLENFAAVINDVIAIDFHSSPSPIWHTLLSVSIPADLIYTYRNGNKLETIKHPYALRLYRTSATAPWTGIAWTTPDYRNDTRRKETLKEETLGDYAASKMTSLLQKAQMKSATQQAASRPKVPVPTMNTMQDLMNWYHGLLMEGDYEKVEAVTLDLLDARFFDKNTRLLDGNGEIVLANLKKALTNDYSTYSQQNCPKPQVMSASATGISWWNRDKSKSTTLEIRSENNRWYLYTVNVYVWNYVESARAEATMNASCK